MMTPLFPPCVPCNHCDLCRPVRDLIQVVAAAEHVPLQADTLTTLASFARELEVIAATRGDRLSRAYRVLSTTPSAVSGNARLWLEHMTAYVSEHGGVEAQ